jgi:HK97 gp10 family phage protein
MARNMVSFEGAKEIEDNLRKVTVELQRKILGEALVAGAQPIRDEAEATVVRSTGKLAQNIIIEQKRSKQAASQDVLSVRVMPRRTKLGAPDDAHYGSFVELGTSKMAAQPFLRPAFDSKRVESLEAAAETIRVGVEQVLK